MDSGRASIEEGGGTLARPLVMPGDRRASAPEASCASEPSHDSSETSTSGSLPHPVDSACSDVAPDTATTAP